MSYQVLARKWRPRFFDEMVGQEHVLKALINALNEQRLHHAYLFTGTRGVGKTTIARILAKCLNCEEGISARPCGVCSSCREIAEGRFVDLIEVDAASRTKVEDTRELLDNVQYAPTRGRFKVYLIDEVHMLSTHSFNALLKTLEEPPAHVKFLLATTDPQKLPVTVLSRCLQFSLKNMTPESIVGYLETVLQAENIRYEPPALWQLGRAAQGSMRDALSLTDQAIAFGEGTVLETQVTSMLGTMDRGRLFKMAEVMAKANARDVLAEVAEMAEHGPDYDEVVQGLLTIWHRAALAQVVPDAIENSQGDRDAILALALAMNGEDLQLYYQVALSGRKDLTLAPDPRQGFEMLLLRMLAFRPLPEQLPEALANLDLGSALSSPSALVSPAQPALIEAQKKKPLTEPSDLGQSEPKPVQSEPVQPEPVQSEPTHAAPVVDDTQATPFAADEPLAEPGAEPVPVTVAPPVVSPAEPEQESPPWSEEEAAEPLPSAAPPAVPPSATLMPEPVKPAPAQSAPTEAISATKPHTSAAGGNLSRLMDAPADHSMTFEPAPAAPTATKAAVTKTVPREIANPADLPPLTPASWWMWLEHLPLAGLPLSIARNSALVEIRDGYYCFDVDPQQGALFNPGQQQRIEQALQTLVPDARIEMVLRSPAGETPEQRRQRLAAEAGFIALQSIETDEQVRHILTTFNATVVDGTIRPLDD
ncbi:MULTISPECIES: DNA polymerase III subunit gamma/tau [unclassified Oceanobacter]|uniref:DNA polymerase III subunit gamma/tau n=1 Tax=unclassified Oceanobacter TaxID=2620260 RepID=UPI0027351944|nr:MULTISPECIES: DNA polymerase III subunit gamma/tau [unclassified Oceanobacter]MDP2610246.1 DNA polymerase III subunit gamma/tau [Oceanobacter sp. 1_MG-2023]MDP2613514.1 DNA polymerase III subunit gamma/tau [Oceanobacter sp. 2_MG-2023]